MLVMIKIIFPFILSVKRLCCLKGDENAVSRDETGRITPQKNITRNRGNLSKVWASNTSLTKTHKRAPWEEKTRRTGVWQSTLL
ncbi:hypothetical protein KsCSTR_27880 [Candidatus Kuenenia stuttgartiensis]|uniref:Uncharacterized protein n=2 Tax=Candidatus Brocadiaceae TaxID=1127830 RepID=A0A6G7GSI7_KUEST|nr:hypothetical protein [Candidatus Kuenenia stuttgartiensis]QII12167.1 hypothetical protein KsCSTR_27880 [Candidatus Kuenenia stuttgartiensis]